MFLARQCKVSQFCNVWTGENSAPATFTPETNIHKQRNLLGTNPAVQGTSFVNIWASTVYVLSNISIEPYIP